MYEWNQFATISIVTTDQEVVVTSEESCTVVDESSCEAAAS